MHVSIVENHDRERRQAVIPAEAGIQACSRVGGKPVKTDTYEITFRYLWIPASAGMTFFLYSSEFFMNNSG